MTHVRHLTLLAATALACSGKLDQPDAASPPTPTPLEASVADDASSALDISEIVTGIADGGRDPAVVAIDLGGEGFCTGTLIATNVLLTARHCVSQTVNTTCPAQGAQVVTNRDPTSLAILLGDDVTTAQVAAHGFELVLPFTGEICDHDIAGIILDSNLDIPPNKLTKAGPESGHFVRTVGFGTLSADGGASPIKLLREYMTIGDISPTEFAVGEACTGDSGGPAFDESTGDLLGVVSRSGAACEGPDVHDVYTRADAFADLIAAALAEGVAVNAAAGLSTAKKAAAGKPPTDIGQPCTTAADCSTGVCVNMPTGSYCSRTCDSQDRCAAGFHCTPVDGTKVCVEK